MQRIVHQSSTKSSQMFRIVCNRFAGRGSKVLCVSGTQMEVSAMTIENALRSIAGTFVLVSLGLAHFVSPLWLLLTAFVGLNLLQSGFTGWCPMMWLLERLRVPRPYATTGIQSRKER
jgi:hypothetical protein